MKESYLSIEKRIRSEMIIEKSRFICTMEKVAGEEEAKLFIQEIKNEFKDATHNCSAFIADMDGCIQRFSDDGEPQGTAGIPMLETLKNKNLFCTAAVITRYFGGIKLGTGGLARAYSDGVSECIKKGKIVDNIRSFSVFMHLPYPLYSGYLQFLEKNGGLSGQSDFLENGVDVTADFPMIKQKEIIGGLNSLFSGKINIEIKESGYRVYENK